MRSTIQRLKNSKFFMSFSVLASGSIVAQLMTISTSPITTRLFTPEEFGTYTLITTAVGLFGPVICLKYDMAIVTSKSEKAALSVIKLSIIICTFLSLIISIIYGLIFIRNEFPIWLLWIYIFSLFLLLFLYGINNILLAFNNRNSLYKLISSVTVIKSAVSSGLMVLGGLLHFGVGGLVVAQIFSSFSGVWKQSNELRKKYYKIKAININVLKATFFMHKRQPIYNASSALISTTLYSSVNLFIKVAYSAEHLGLYSLSYRMLGIPFSIISANIARIFFESATKELNINGNYKKTFIKTITLLTILVIPLLLLIAIISPWLFSFVFGPEWETAGLYVRILAPMFAVRLITESLTTSFIVSNKQHTELIFQGLLLFCELVIFIISYLNNISIENFLLLISLLYVSVYSIIIFFMYKLSANQ
jgi:O-antigen/teichoic acid export membrane protein